LKIKKYKNRFLIIALVVALTAITLLLLYS
jgi:hypothetical protein